MSWQSIIQKEILSRESPTEERKRLPYPTLPYQHLPCRSTVSDKDGIGSFRHRGSEGHDLLPLRGSPGEIGMKSNIVLFPTFSVICTVLILQFLGLVHDTQTCYGLLLKRVFLLLAWTSYVAIL